MLGQSIGAVLVGIDAHPIQVEVDLTGGLPVTSALGLPGSAVREGLERIRSAVQQSRLKWPTKKIVVNLAPADLPKRGTSLDLPIAAAILAASDECDFRIDAKRVMLVGELALDGSLRVVRGALAMALAAREAGLEALLVPRQNAAEAGLVAGLHVVGLSGLADLLAWAKGDGGTPASLDPASHLGRETDEPLADLDEVRGQAGARRALEVAAAGGHHLLLHGPPGSGKTMLARRLPGILPPLELDEALEVTRVWGAAGLASGLVTRRPFRAPHHGISAAGLTGGGPWLRPGEVALASHGVLYLDELPEFRRDVLESLRQPIEDGVITIVRVRAAATLPARFTLVASMNPCACGWHGSPDDRCDCTSREIQRYRARLSGPLLDRFDLTVRVPAVDVRALAAAHPGESSRVVRERVVAARKRQRERFGDGGPACNARMGPRDLGRHARLPPPAEKLLLAACKRHGITARGYDRVRRVARTLADLAGAEGIGAREIAEALQYRHHEPLEPYGADVR